MSPFVVRLFFTALGGCLNAFAAEETATPSRHFHHTGRRRTPWESHGYTATNQKTSLTRQRTYSTKHQATLSRSCDLPVASSSPKYVPGGSLDPTTIPKYVTPLPILGVMQHNGALHTYDVAVRQFKQQILPGGIWDSSVWGSSCRYNMPATTVFGYGPAQDPQPDSSSVGGSLGIAPADNSQFSAPSNAIVSIRNKTVKVNWINDLVADPWSCSSLKAHRRIYSPACRFAPHILPIDRSLHWANPEGLQCTNPKKKQDCTPDPIANKELLLQRYSGPVPISVHVHGALVSPESDGYPEAWFLPAANDVMSFKQLGSIVNKFGASRVTNTQEGVANFVYSNDSPSTLLWFHDHTLGMSRNNVYSGQAGVWVIKADEQNGETGLVSGTLPSPGPRAGQSFSDLNLPTKDRHKIRELILVIQDRSFNTDGSLFYPDNRQFFEGLTPGKMDIPFTGSNIASDVPPIWNPEFFANVMVVNGVTWPKHEVKPFIYRFRILNGCDSRALNMALYVLKTDGTLGEEIPLFQIGGDQGLLPRVIMITTGYKTELRGNGQVPSPEPADSEYEALLMGPAERVDILIDFSTLPVGTELILINSAPDSPFQGFSSFSNEHFADPETTGQVMKFAVIAADQAEVEVATHPSNLLLSLPGNVGHTDLPSIKLAMMEEDSEYICVKYSQDSSGTVTSITWDKEAHPNEGACTLKDGSPASSIVYGPTVSMLGMNSNKGGIGMHWSDPIKTISELGTTEIWEIWDWTDDAHPVHVHPGKFIILSRQAFDKTDGTVISPSFFPTLSETGFKDTAFVYPGQILRILITFDLPGLYVWHCHMSSHEDHDMMVPYCVGDLESAPGCRCANNSLHEECAVQQRFRGSSNIPGWCKDPVELSLRGKGARSYCRAIYHFQNLSLEGSLNFDRNMLSIYAIGVTCLAAALLGTVSMAIRMLRRRHLSSAYDTLEDIEVEQQL